ncbi:MAG: hypothetical protein JWM53_3366 [bacterium]|nr:hypothetical protein [bacterium]
MKRAARIATLFVPSLGAWLVVRANLPDAAGVHADPLVQAGLTALLPLYCVMAAALVVRAFEAAGARRSWAEAFDILTAPGRALVWTAALATAGASVVGWASLAVLGLCGLAVAYVTVTWAALVAAGDEPWRALAVARGFVPATAVEGDALREELAMTGARVPAGFRLIVRAGVTRHVSTLYALDSDISDGDISLAADLGPARRGEYDVPPAELWLQDLFGLCRSRVMRLGAGKLTVLPRPAAVDDLAAIAAARGDDAESVPAQTLPTEGCFRLRAYATGDDARRIHWVRSLMARELVVRLPDELPPEQPMVRLVLDTQLVGAAALPTPATGQLCDALVRVWLSAGQALVARGVRVMMVAAADEPARVVERAMTPQSSGSLLRVGARVRWQASLPVDAMVGDEGVRNIVVSARPRPIDGAAVRWIVVPELVWTDPEPPPLRDAWATLPYPSGAADNRWTRRRREKQTHEAMRRGGVLFDQLCQWADGPHLEGSFVARPRGARVALEAMS